jgi:hypothetical protein
MIKEKSKAGPVFAHGTTGAKRQLAPPATIIKICKKKNCEALQYCDSNEFIKLTVGISRVLMSKRQQTIFAAINIEHNVNIHM